MNRNEEAVNWGRLIVGQSGPRLSLRSLQRSTLSNANGAVRIAVLRFCSASALRHSDWWTRCGKARCVPSTTSCVGSPSVPLFVLLKFECELACRTGPFSSRTSIAIRCPRMVSAFVQIAGARRDRTTYAEPWPLRGASKWPIQAVADSWQNWAHARPHSRHQTRGCPLTAAASRFASLIGLASISIGTTSQHIGLGRICWSASRDWSTRPPYCRFDCRLPRENSAKPIRRRRKSSESNSALPGHCWDEPGESGRQPKLLDSKPLIARAEISAGSRRPFRLTGRCRQLARWSAMLARRPSSGGWFPGHIGMFCSKNGPDGVTPRAYKVFRFQIAKRGSGPRQALW